MAKKFAEKEYSNFRIVQDREYKSDFDKVIENIKTTSSLPKEKEIIPINPLSISSVSKLRKREEDYSDFNQKLKKGLSYNPKKEKE